MRKLPELWKVQLRNANRLAAQLFRTGALGKQADQVRSHQKGAHLQMGCRILLQSMRLRHNRRSPPRWSADCRGIATSRWESANEEHGGQVARSAAGELRVRAVEAAPNR